MPAYYARDVAEFLCDSDTSVLGHLAEANTRARFLQLESAAIEAWRQQIALLRIVLSQIVTVEPEAAAWGFLLEFPIPRRQRRADLILLARDIIFVFEFKTTRADISALRQVEDYALDLADFHEPSQNTILIPVVVAPSGDVSSRVKSGTHGLVGPVTVCTPEEMGNRLLHVFRSTSNSTRTQISIKKWDQGAYHPIPTIIEAAQSIFAGMEVREIAHAASDAHNLTRTVDAVFDLTLAAKMSQRKTICFLTGVPGSGKSLAGLRAVHDPRSGRELGTDPHFLSGNGPLVNILREALTRDFARRDHNSRKTVRRKVETLIQNVHVFAKYYWDENPRGMPHEKVIVFDEAQRAWNAERNYRKFQRPISEPTMILRIMDRHPDWAVIIALVGADKRSMTEKRG